MSLVWLDLDLNSLVQILRSNKTQDGRSTNLAIPSGLPLWLETIGYVFCVYINFTSSILPSPSAAKITFKASNQIMTIDSKEQNGGL